VAGALCDKTDFGGDGELLLALLFIVQTPLLVLLPPSDWNTSSHIKYHFMQALQEVQTLPQLFKGKFCKPNVYLKC
jgi:hypothetical protein